MLKSDGIKIVCSSPEMAAIARTIRLSTGRNLLLTGESGTGKDVLARWAHSISPSADGPFVAVNCAAIQESLWESEIFGHAKGAFTGAVRDKLGQLEVADGGTLFLNEIGDMPPPAQAKLLSFLDTGEFQRIGETELRRVDARVISATNHELDREIEKGSFRLDLYYRIASVHVKIPPLRERPEDIQALADLQLDRLNAARSGDPVSIGSSVREPLARAPWRGNCRELFGAVETAFYQCLEAGEGSLAHEHFGAAIETGAKEDSSAGLEPDGRSRPLVIGRFGHRAVDASGPNAREPRKARANIIEDPAALRAELDRFVHPSGRWNVTQAHRELHEQGVVKIGRRAFTRRVKILFPDR